MAMGARFDEVLQWDGDDLEVCGPGLFDNGVGMVEVISFSITDKNGNSLSHLCIPPARAVPGQNGGMWESEIPNAKGRLVSGPATGQGFALLIRGAGQPPIPFHWTQPVPPLSIA